MPYQFIRDEALQDFLDSLGATETVAPTHDEYWNAATKPEDPPEVRCFIITDDGLIPLYGHVEVCRCATCGALVQSPTEDLLRTVTERHEAEAHDRDIDIKNIGEYASV